MTKTGLAALVVLLVAAVAVAQRVDTIIGLPDTTALRGMALNENNGLIFCTDAGWKSLQIIDAEQRAFVDTVLGHDQPEEIIWNPVNGKLYVANAGGTGSVKVCDGTTGEILNSIPAGGGATVLAFNRTNNKLYCANQADGTVSVIDCATETVLATLTVGPLPWDLAWNEAENKVYCTVEDGASVAIIDGVSNQLVGAVETGAFPWSIVSNDSFNRVYYSVLGANTVEALNCATGQLLTSIPVGPGPRGIAWNSRLSNTVYVSCYGGRWIDVIDCITNQVVNHIGAGSGVDDLFYEPANNKLYCAFTLTDSVSVIDCDDNQIITTLRVEYRPTKMVRYTAAGDTILVFVACANKSLAVLRDNPAGGIEAKSTRPQPRPLAVYPNPANRMATLDFGPGFPGRRSVQVVDGLGRVRLETSAVPDDLGRVELRIPVLGLEPGVYFVRTDDVRQAVEPLVIAR